MVETRSAKKDYRDIAQGFGACTVAVIILYLMSGMTAVNMREVHLSTLMAVLTACCAFYVTCAFINTSKKYYALASAVPVFGIYYLIFKLSFDACNRMTLPALSIMEGVLLWAGLGTVIVSVIVLYAGHKFEFKDLITAVLAAGFIMRAVMVLFTPLNFHQHDVSSFSPDQVGFHDSYIMYIYNNFTIPSGDVRDLGQFYHPPLHYFISAMFLRFQNLLPLRFKGDVNGLKMLPMLWTSFLVLFAKKILEHLKIKGKAMAFSLLLIVFCPQIIFLSIQVNNDALALMLFASSIYVAFKWSEKPELTTIILLALSIGCAMMTKLSMGFVAFPVAWIFLVKLINTVKKNKKIRGKRPELRNEDLIKQYLTFGLFVIPLGLWFPFRNRFVYGTPFTYVYEIDSSANQDVWMFSKWQRLFAPSKALLKTPFLQEGGEINDFNIFLAIMKTGLFDERKFTQPYMIAIARLMMFLAFILVLAVAVFGLWGAYKRFRKADMKILAMPEKVSLWILAITLIVSEYIFCFKHPVVCTQAFRYIAPVLIPAAFWTGSVIQASDENKDDKTLRICSMIIMASAGLFALSVILFYGPFTEYSMPWEMLIK